MYLSAGGGACLWLGRAAGETRENTQEPHAPVGQGHAGGDSTRHRRSSVVRLSLLSHTEPEK